MKRLVDLVLAVSIFFAVLPLMAVIAVMIRKTSNGPSIFAQDRVGKNEIVFKCLKFRTMTLGSPDVASHQASAVWITPIGRILRRFKLDELPQLINVIRGDMSLVGPRPCLPTQEELIYERRRRGVFCVKPGITGSSQVAGIDMSDPVRLAEADSAYVKTRNLKADLAILIMTAAGKGSGDATLR